jgi:hypothetical protein
MEISLHDVPEGLAHPAIKRAKALSGTPFEKPCPLASGPEVPTKVLLGRDERFLPADFQCRVARERLGVIPGEMSGGLLVALSQPQELPDRLERYVKGASVDRRPTRFMVLLVRLGGRRSLSPAR